MEQLQGLKDYLQEKLENTMKLSVNMNDKICKMTRQGASYEEIQLIVLEHKIRVSEIESLIEEIDNRINLQKTV